jgi:hypothetical protein
MDGRWLEFTLAETDECEGESLARIGRLFVAHVAEAVPVPEM